MNCEQFKNNLALKVGGLSLDNEEKVHLESCANCAKYYKHLFVLEKNLSLSKIDSLTADESRAFESRLESSIEEYESRATHYYRISVRYGASLAAVLILLFVSFFHHLRTPAEKPLNTDSLLTALQLPDSTEESSAEEIETPYLDVVIGNYVEDHGFNSSEMIIGDLSPEELKYLESKMKAGDIL